MPEWIDFIFSTWWVSLESNNFWIKFILIYNPFSQNTFLFLINALLFYMLVKFSFKLSKKSSFQFFAFNRPSLNIVLFHIISFCTDIARHTSIHCSLNYNIHIYTTLFIFYFKPEPTLHFEFLINSFTFIEIFSQLKLAKSSFYAHFFDCLLFFKTSLSLLYTFNPNSLYIPKNSQMFKSCKY